MPSSLPYKQAANVERRTWDKEAYEAKAKARIQAENGSSQNHKKSNDEQQSSNEVGQKRSLAETILAEEDGDHHKEEFQRADKGRAGPMNSKRAFLKARTHKVDLESKVGTSEIINPDEATKSSVQITDGVSKAGGSGGVGWHCNVCDCYLKDSLTYLDHINGKKHQRALGYSMRTEKSTTNDVSNRLQSLVEERKRKEEEEKQKELEMSEGNHNEEDKMNEFDKMVKQKDEEISKRKAERKKRREERRKKAQQEKMNPTIDLGGGGDHQEEVEGEGEDEGAQPDIAALMGFSGFGAQ